MGIPEDEMPVEDIIPSDGNEGRYDNLRKNQIEAF
jgi:hypothetical protein